MCDLLLMVGSGAFVLWLLRQLMDPERPKPSAYFPPIYPSPFVQDGDQTQEGGYSSPLGLVDNPEDEWVEWAIMLDTFDGPDEGLFR